METKDILLRKRENILISALIDPYNPQMAYYECLMQKLLIRVDEPSEQEKDDPKYFYKYLLNNILIKII